MKSLRSKLVIIDGCGSELDYLNNPKRNDAGLVSIPYEGLLLLRC